MTRRNSLVVILAFLVLVMAGSLVPARLHAAQDTAAGSAAKPFTYEFSYKIKWGHLDEFLEFHKKSHLPILRKQVKRGEILRM